MVGFSFVFHLTMFLWYVFGITYDTLYIYSAMEFRKTYGGRWKFLTFWNMCVQCSYFGLCVLNDLFGSNSYKGRSRHSLQVLRDTFLASIAFPLGVFVSASFWTLYSIDRELVYPKYVDEFIPVWYNHQSHTTISLFIAMEMYLFHHEYPSKKVGMFLAVCFGTVYQVWILWIAYHANIYVYPVLKVLDGPLLVGFFAVCWMVLIALYALGQILNNAIWVTESPKETLAREPIAVHKKSS